MNQIRKIEHHPKQFSSLIRGQVGRRSLSTADFPQFLFLDSTYEHLIENEGELMSAITVGVAYRNKLIFGALFDSGILVC